VEKKEKRKKGDVVLLLFTLIYFFLRFLGTGSCEPSEKWKWGGK